MCTQTIYWCIDLFFMKSRQYPDHVGMCTQTIYGLLFVKYKQHPGHIEVSTQIMLGYKDVITNLHEIYKKHPDDIDSYRDECPG